MLGLLISIIVLCGTAEGAIRREIICRLSVYPNGQNINWTCPEQRIVYEDKGWYIPKNILPSRVQMVGNKAYILTPKFSSGVPFSLGVVSMGGPCKAEPVLSPYPSWESQDPSMGGAAGGGGIVNAVDVFVDRKKILWVLDIGITDTLNKPQRVGPPKVHAICIQSSTVVAALDLSNFATSESRFHEIQVEVTEEEDTYVYVSDSGSKAIIVWDYSKSTGYKVALPPEAADDGAHKDILYLTLMCTNVLYFSFMNGHKMFRTSTNNLRSSNILTEAEEIRATSAKLVILGSDKKTKMFFRGKGDNQIYMWDTCNPFKPASLVAIDAPIQGMYSTHVAVGYMRLMWALSSNFPDFATGNLGSVGPYVKLHPICSATRCGEEVSADNSSGNGIQNTGNGYTASNIGRYSKEPERTPTIMNPQTRNQFLFNGTSGLNLLCTPPATDLGAAATIRSTGSSLEYSTNQPDVCARCGQIKSISPPRLRTYGK